MSSAINSEPGKKDPSLKKYFKYMINSRKVIVKFSLPKIKEIIKNDLQIDFENIFSELLQDVSIDMFSFYIQTWPGWQPEQFQNSIDHPEESYNNFTQYLKEKILKLQEKEHLYDKPEDTSKNEAEGGGFVLNPPRDAFKQLPTENTKRKVKFAHSLEITSHPKVFNSLKFESNNGKITVSLHKQLGFQRMLSTAEALNHPYVGVLFKLPDLIKFSRKNVHKIEMFLCKSSDNWQFPPQNRIVDIRKFPARNGVYTSDFLKLLFNNIITEVDRHAQKLPAFLKQDIESIFNEFLKDILEANINDSTMQECTEICLNIGGTSYYCDSKQKSEPINLRRVYQPQILYCLVYCGIKPSDISINGINYFRQMEEGGEANEMRKKFISHISQSIHLSCLMCNIHFKDMWTLKQHLLETHYSADIVVCTKCKQEGHLHEIIERRWAHECKNNQTTSTPTGTTSGTNQ